MNESFILNPATGYNSGKIERDFKKQKHKKYKKKYCLFSAI